MPKSRRDKPVALTKVQKHSRAVKERLLASIRLCVSAYPSIYVFDLHHPRNARLKELREEWGGSRFFLGKTRVMQAALGRTSAEEPRGGTSRLAPYLVGQRGLLFTHTHHAQVVDFFARFADPHFARSGAIAPRAFELERGPLSADVAPHPLEPHLRKLGLPTRLRGGVVELMEGVVVCREGDVLTPEQCRLLELFGERMAVMRVGLVARWWRGGGEGGEDGDEGAGEEVGQGGGGVVEELREGVVKEGGHGAEEWRQSRARRGKKDKRGGEEAKRGPVEGNEGEEDGEGKGGEEGEEGESEEGEEDEEFVPEPLEGWGEVAVPSY